MNISQHAFVPINKLEKNKYYNTSGSLVSGSIDTFPSQPRYGMNCFLLSQNYVGTNQHAIRYKLVYLNPYYGFPNLTIPENRIVSSSFVSENVAFGQYFTYYPNVPRGMIFHVGFYLTSLVNLFTNFVDDEER